MNYNIPDNEKENLLSVYWQMLMELESKTDPSKDTYEKNLIEGAFKLLHRCGCIPVTNKPFWMK